MRMIFSPPCLRRTGTCALLLAAACGTARPSLESIPPAAEPKTRLQRGTAVTRYPAGAFVVMEERYTLPAGRTPIMHVPTEWTKIHLSFDAPGGHVNVSLTDNGSRLGASVITAGCQSGGSYLQYDGEHPDQRHLYEAMEGTVRTLIRHCTRDREVLRQTLLLLRRARRDFPAALEVMKSRAGSAFGGRWTRCTYAPPGERGPFHPCVFP